VERTFGKADVLSVTYLGAAGRKLMRTDNYDAPNPNFTGEFTVMRNDADSSYNALQTQYRHRFSHGLQTLLSYTWAHAIDDASSDAYPVNLPASDAPLFQERGSSDYDIRHTFSGAVSYKPEEPWHRRCTPLDLWPVSRLRPAARSLLRHWEEGPHRCRQRDRGAARHGASVPDSSASPLYCEMSPHTGHAGEAIEQRQYRVPDCAADIFEIDVDSVRTSLSQLFPEVTRPVTDCRIEAELVRQVETLVRSTGRTNSPRASHFWQVARPASRPGRWPQQRQPSRGAQVCRLA
jgi:hypothetical protein